MGMMMIFFCCVSGTYFRDRGSTRGTQWFRFSFCDGSAIWIAIWIALPIVFKMLHTTMAFTIASSLHLAQCT